MVASSDPEKTRDPPPSPAVGAAAARARTAEAWPVRTAAQAGPPKPAPPVGARASHARTLPSYEPEKMRPPAPAASVRTGPVCPTRVAMQAPVAGSHTRTVES